jgi:membrane protein insertase Oxa1/YidC/SpoIIIJ
MKKFGLIITTLVLFSLSIYVAFMQGSVSGVMHQSAPDSIISAVQTPVMYTGIKAVVAESFSFIFSGLMYFMAHNILLAIIALALLVELILLYPSVRIQLKQKKIHLFHKKLIDRFNNGELSVSKTEEELYKLYDVNEKIHHRGALMVVAQVIVFFYTFWGMNLIANAPEMLNGSWNFLNFSMLGSPSGYALPFFVSIVYFAHGITKIYFKSKEDYISSPQVTLSLIFSVIGSVLVYFFVGIFPAALSVYFVTLITVATIRFILAEQHSRGWGKQAQKELVEMLHGAKAHENRFEYLSRVWNHLPIVRHINFCLLEEALSMTLGLLLALSFFGAFQKTELHIYLNKIQPQAIVQAEQINFNI